MNNAIIVQQPLLEKMLTNTVNSVIENNGKKFAQDLQHPFEKMLTDTIYSVIDKNGLAFVKLLQPLVENLFDKILETHGSEFIKDLRPLVDKLLDDLIKTDGKELITKLQPLFVNMITSENTQQEVAILLHKLLVDGNYSDNVGKTFQNVLVSILTSERTRDAIQKSADTLQTQNIIAHLIKPYKPAIITILVILGISLISSIISGIFSLATYFKHQKKS